MERISMGTMWTKQTGFAVSNVSASMFLKKIISIPGIKV